MSQPPGAAERTAGLAGDDETEGDAQAQTGQSRQGVGEPGPRRVPWARPAVGLLSLSWRPGRRPLPADSRVRRPAVVWHPRMRLPG